MFETTTTHVCAITDVSSRSFLPKLPPDANICRRWKRFCKKLILITELNPQSILFYRSVNEITLERKKQVDSGSWIVHPFSTLRLYYEMWMTIVFFLCLIYYPLDASYKYYIFGAHEAMEAFLGTACFIDIFMNFRTGYCASSETVVMSTGKVFCHYMFGPFFICDVVSSIPDLYFEDKNISRIFDFLAMLKIVRIFTFLHYLERTLYYFKVRSMAFLFIKLLLMVMLVVHYTACFLFAAPLLHFYARDDTYFQRVENTTEQFQTFWNMYVKYFYSSWSVLLGVDHHFDYDDPWISYFFVIIIYFGGKILVTFVTVVFLDIFHIRNCLERKYHEIMNQVGDYMSVHQFPIKLQKKMNQYYYYKYRNRFFNESKIDKFISEKLKREIKYHDCRRLILSVRIFENLPQSILEKILSHLKSEIYLPMDEIIKAGSQGDTMYFLSSGTVAVLSPSGKEICHLIDGDYFGEISLLWPKEKRTANVVALEICEVFKLDRKSFKKCLEPHQTLFKDVVHQAKKRYASTKEIERAFLRNFADRI